MSYWIKIFSDYSIENGSDYNIINNNASWTKGRLVDIGSVNLFFVNKLVSVCAPNTEWYQFDRYLSLLISNTTQNNRVARIVQFKINKDISNKYIHIYKYSNNRVTIYVSSRKSDIKLDNYLNKWVSVILEKNGNINMRLSDKKGII